MARQWFVGLQHHDSGCENGKERQHINYAPKERQRADGVDWNTHNLRLAYQGCLTGFAGSGFDFQRFVSDFNFLAGESSPAGGASGF
jgi:hypothetical protein